MEGESLKVGDRVEITYADDTTGYGVVTRATHGMTLVNPDIHTNKPLKSMKKVEQ